MASTAQICLPYAGVEKERKMRSRAVRTHIGATANAWTTRQTLWRLPQVRRQLIQSLRSDGEMPTRISAFERKKPQQGLFSNCSIVVWRNKLEHWQCAITRNLARAIVCLAGRRLAISPVPDPGPWPAFFPVPRQTARSVLDLWPAQRAARRRVQVTSQSTRTARIGRAPHWRS